MPNIEAGGLADFQSPFQSATMNTWILVQVTNAYEAYQMIAFGELIEWPLWAEVLSR